MSIVGHALIALGVAYLSAVVWLLGKTRRRSSFLTQTSIAIAFTGLCALCSGMVYVRAARGLDYDFFYRAASVGWLPFASMMTLIYELQGKSRQGKVAGAALYLLWSTNVVLCVGTDYVELGAETLVPFVDRVGPLEPTIRVIGSACFLWALVELARSYRASRGLQRQRTAYFFLGLALYAVLGLFGAAGFQLVGSVAFDPTLTVAFSVPWVALTFYAVSRHRLFDVRVVASRILLGALAAAVATGSVGAMFWMLRDSVGDMGAAMLAALATSVLFIATPMERLVSAARGRSHNDVVATETLGAMLELDDLLMRILGMLKQNLGVLRGAILLQDSKGGYELAHALELPAEHPSASDETSPVLSWLRENRGVLILEEQEHQMEDRARAVVSAEMLSWGAEVAVAIVRDDRVSGVVLLGPKEDGEAFLQRDVDLLMTLVSQAALAIDNAQLYSALNAAMLDLDEFVRAAAHDLRSPLLGIDHLARFAQEDLEESDGDEAGEHLEKLRGRVQRMRGLLDAMETYVRAGRGEPKLEEADVRKLAQQVIEEVDAPLGFSLRVDSDEVCVHTATRLLVEVLAQLADNAVTHHDRDDGTVTVTVRDAGALVELCVEDDGPGIDADFQSRIFEMFRRLERRDVSEGAGLGLALCRKLVTRAGGQLWVTSPVSDGRGAAFHFTWPRRWPDAPSHTLWRALPAPS